MFPYYPFYANYHNSFYGIQNPTPIGGFNFEANFQYFPINSYIKKQQEPLENYQHNPCSDPTKSHEQRKSLQKQIQTIVQKENLQKNQEVQSLSEKNSSFQGKSNKSKLIEKSKLRQGRKKVRVEKKDKAYVAKQYPKQQPSINCRYIQKNFELNIINQVFSFLWSQEKSMKYVRRFYKDNIKANLYYEYVKIVRKFCKRYINKEYLKNLCDYQNHHIAYKMVSKNTQKLEYLSMSEFSRCIRHLILIYLHQLCPQAILTSKKMRRQIWSEHLIKCRLLRDFMFYNLSGEEYERELIHNRGEENKMVESTSEDLMS